MTTAMVSALTGRADLERILQFVKGIGERRFWRSLNCYVILHSGRVGGEVSACMDYEALTALDAMNALMSKRPTQLTSQDLLSIHALILTGIDDTNAGRYRTLRWLTAENALHPVVRAGEANYRLVTRHPSSMATAGLHFPFA